MLRRLNPFRRRTIPIYKHSGGWEPWKNRQKPKRMSWRPFVVGCGGLFALCGATLVFLVSLLGSRSTLQPTPTLNLTDFNPIVEFIDNRTTLPLNEELTPIQLSESTMPLLSATITRTPIPTRTLEATQTPEPSPTPTVTPTALTSTRIGDLPTYTPYPTYTPQKPQVEVIVRTSPPQIYQQPAQIIRETQIVVQVDVVEIPVTVVHYQVITATPSITPWAEEPDYNPTGLPIIGMTTTRGRHAPDS